MRGAVAAGMCLVLEAAGLMPSFDRVYGCSSGAMTGAYAAAGQASLWATSFEDCACREFIDPARAFRGGPLVDLDFLFDEVIARRRPLSAAGLAEGPELRAVAVAADSAELRVLGGFADAADLLGALRASCALPLLAGAAPTYRGETLVDGGLLEPIPYRSGAARGRDARARPALARRELPRAPPGPLRRARARARPAGAGDAAAELQPALPPRRRRAPAPRARRARRSSSRSPCPPAAASSRASPPTPRASPPTSGSAPSRWPPRSTAPAPRSSGSRSPSCS